MVQELFSAIDRSKTVVFERFSADASGGKSHSFTKIIHYGFEMFNEGRQ